ncbi:exostosin-like 2 [Stigmatopora argus]
MESSTQQKAKKQLANFRFGCRRGLLSLCFMLLLLLVGGILKFWNPPQADCAEKPLQFTQFAQFTPLKKEEFTLIIQTFKRDNILLKVLKRCLAVPHLQKILIVWNNVGNPPSQKFRDSLGPHDIPIIFLEQKINDLQNRLQPFSEINTDAVLMLDDDVLLSVSDINFAFNIWKQAPDQIVGFVPRTHVETTPGVYNYDGNGLSNLKKEVDRYSMVLIGAAFFHHRYLKLYQEQPEEVHSLVDSIKNCEDIAMNFVVASYLRQHWPGSRPAGVFAKPVEMGNLEMEANGDFKGLWHRQDHFAQRSHCLTQLAQIYGGMPLQFSNIMMTHFS